MNSPLKDALLALVTEVEELRAWQLVTTAAVGALPQYASVDTETQFDKALAEGKETYQSLRTSIEESSL